MTTFLVYLLMQLVQDVAKTARSLIRQFAHAFLPRIPDEAAPAPALGLVAEDANLGLGLLFRGRLLRPRAHFLAFRRFSRFARALTSIGAISHAHLSKMNRLVRDSLLDLRANAATTAAKGQTSQSAVARNRAIRREAGPGETSGSMVRERFEFAAAGTVFPETVAGAGAFLAGSAR